MYFQEISNCKLKLGAARFIGAIHVWGEFSILHRTVGRDHTMVTFTFIRPTQLSCLARTNC